MSFYLNDFKYHLTALAERSKKEGVADYTEPVRPWQNTVSLTEAYRGMNGSRKSQQLNETSPPPSPPFIKSNSDGIDAAHTNLPKHRPWITTRKFTYPDWPGYPETKGPAPEIDNSKGPGEPYDPSYYYPPNSILQARPNLQTYVKGK